MGRRKNDSNRPGSVREVPAGSGSWVCRLRNEYLGTRDTEDAGWALVEAAEKDEKENMDARSVRVKGDAYLKVREEQEKIRRPKGAYVESEQNQPLWDRYVVPSAFINKRVEKVTRDDIVELIGTVVGRPCVRWSNRSQSFEPTGQVVGKRTAKKILSLLRGFFASCDKMKYGNPVTRDIPIPNIARQSKRVDKDRIPHLHADEIDRLFALPIEHFTQMHRAVYALGIYAGLRRGEIAGLEWKNIVDLYSENPFDPEIWVRKSYACDPKTQSSQRELPMLPQLVRELRLYRASLQIIPAHDSLVFPSPATGGVRSRQWDPQWRDVAAGKGRRHQPGFRSLALVRDHIQHKHVRHSCATHLIKGTFFASGKAWPIERVSILLGHTEIKMTKKHYADAGVDLLKENLAASLADVSNAHGDAE